MSRGIAAVLCLTLLLGGCAGMSNTEQRVLSGGSIGAVISERAGDRVLELSAVEYLRQSILDPGPLDWVRRIMGNLIYGAIKV